MIILGMKIQEMAISLSTLTVSCLLIVCGQSSGCSGTPLCRAG